MSSTNDMLREIQTIKGGRVPGVVVARLIARMERRILDDQATEAVVVELIRALVDICTLLEQGRDGTGLSEVKKSKAQFARILVRLMALSTDSATEQPWVSVFHRRLRNLVVLAGACADTELQFARFMAELDEAGERFLELSPPCDEELRFGRLRVVGFTSYLDPVGGDWWTAEPTETGGFLFLGDATGHGVRAAVLVPFVKGAFALAAPTADLGDLAKQLSNAIMKSFQGHMLMTALFVDYNEKQSMLRVVSAGHHSPLIVRDGQVHHMALSSGSPLGSGEDLQYNITEVLVHKSDRVVLFTDGIVECCNGLGDEFGSRGLKAVLLDCEEDSASMFLDELRWLLDQHRGRGDFNDDLTVVVLDVV